MDRRSFLKRAGIVAGAMYADLPSFAERVFETGPVRLRIGILSDIHVRNEESAKVFRHALEYFRDREVDGVMIVGDMADDGLERQMKVVADTWFSVFPKDRLPNGNHVERLFVYGNHDVEAHQYGGHRNLGISDEEAAKDAIDKKRERLWKKYYNEKYVPVYLKEIKGYRFVGAHWHSWSETPEAVRFLTEKEALLNYDKPFFYFQHAHPKGTCMGEWAWGQDNGDVTRALSKYPNAVAFSGHSHHPLTDERDIWQGSFTSVGTASLSYLYPLGGRENSALDGESRHLPFEMQALGCQDGKQGMLMTIYDDCISLERREFVYDQRIGDDWIIPLPVTSGKPFSFEQRSKSAKTPEFSYGARVAVREITGRDRYGDEHPQVEVSFPSVLQKRGGVRAFDYEVQVEQRYVDVVNVVATKRVYSKGSYLGEAQDEDDVVCLFAKSELPSDMEYRFAVCPCECFGKKGRAIRSDWMKK